MRVFGKSTTLVIMGMLCISVVYGYSVHRNNETIKTLEKNYEQSLDEVKHAEDAMTTDVIEAGKTAPVFKVHEEIPEDIRNLMRGKSIPKDKEEIFNKLAYIEVAYKDFDGSTQIGEMIVNRQVAREVCDIFKEIYQAGFPVDRMELVDMYDADDIQSMLANNSSSFNYRTIAGTGVLSNHGKGLAIDINPYLNPHVVKGKANPEQAQKYVDRSLDERGMIKKGDIVYNAFAKRGWKWGGEWNNPDYQHFEKEIIE